MLGLVRRWLSGGDHSFLPSSVILCFEVPLSTLVRVNISITAKKGRFVKLRNPSQFLESVISHNTNPAALVEAVGGLKRLSADADDEKQSKLRDFLFRSVSALGSIFSRGAENGKPMVAVPCYDADRSGP